MIFYFNNKRKQRQNESHYSEWRRRETKSKNSSSCSRFEKGNRNDLLKLLGILKNEIPVEYEIFIVQPGLSKEKAMDDILILLGVTATYIKKFADINLKVITSI